VFVTEAVWESKQQEFENLNKNKIFEKDSRNKVKITVASHNLMYSISPG